MTLIKQVKLTPHEAKELIHDGFFLKLIQLYAGDVDLYEVYTI